MKDGYVALKDGRMHYVVEGSGPPVLLLHSLGNSCWSWFKAMPIMGESFTLYALDMMGHGDSDKPLRDYSIIDHARSVVEFMDSQGLSRAHLVGNSVGATLTVEVAASYPHRVGKAVLVGAPARTRQERQAQDAEMPPQFDEEDRPLPRTMEDISNRYVNPTLELLNKVNELRTKAGLWVKKTRDALDNYDIARQLSLVQCPTLVLFGERDQLKEKEDVFLKGIQGSKGVTLRNAGHVPQVDDPATFAQTVLDFLK